VTGARLATLELTQGVTAARTGTRAPNKGLQLTRSRARCWEASRTRPREAVVDCKLVVRPRPRRPEAQSGPSQLNPKVVRRTLSERA
jgi:hypothetical protein